MGYLSFIRWSHALRSDQFSSFAMQQAPPFFGDPGGHALGGVAVGATIEEGVSKKLPIILLCQATPPLGGPGGHALQGTVVFGHQ